MSREEADQDPSLLLYLLSQHAHAADQDPSLLFLSQLAHDADQEPSLLLFHLLSQLDRFQGLAA